MIIFPVHSKKNSGLFCLGFFSQKALAIPGFILLTEKKGH